MDSENALTLAGLLLLLYAAWASGLLGRLFAARPQATAAYQPPPVVHTTATLTPSLEEQILFHYLRGADLARDKEALDGKGKDRMAAANALKLPAPASPKD